MGGNVGEEHRAVLDRHMAAFNAKDPDAYPWTDDIEFVVPGSDPLRGREQVLGFIRGFWDAFPDSRIEIERMIGDGQRGAAEGTFTGTHTGALRTPGGEVPPTERRVEFLWMAMYDFAGDRLAAEHLYFDQAELLGQLGPLPG